jgi:hypothetical protein
MDERRRHENQHSLRLPVMRGARARAPWARLCPLPPLRPTRMGGCEDPPRDQRPARRHGRARLRVRSPGDAAPPGRGVPVPGLRFGGSSRLAVATGKKPAPVAAPGVRDKDKPSEGGRTLSQSRETQRETLPIPDRPHTGLVTYDAKDPETRFPPIEPLRPPEDAPNVLVVLLDDAGFGASSVFGGRARRRTSSGSPTAASATTGSTTRLCARPRGRRF